MKSDLHVVTGAFSYSGKYIAHRLLDAGHRVRTITSRKNHTDFFNGRVEKRPLDFLNHAELVESLRGATVLYNTYWVRFNHSTFTHSAAVDNTLRLFAASKEAGVERVVHVSITNPSEDSPLEYFSGKGQLERALKESGMSYSILRPTVLFGKEDILINNMAWVIRNFPIVGVFGNGTYRLQPIYVDDLARLAVEQGALRGDRIINAIGPETFTYKELLIAISKAIGINRPILPIPPWLGHLSGIIIGRFVNDVIITKEEIKGLMGDLLYVNDTPAGTVRLSDWMAENASKLGKVYASELARRE